MEDGEYCERCGAVRVTLNAVIDLEDRLKFLCAACAFDLEVIRSNQRIEAELATLEQFGGVDAPAGWFPGCGW